MSGREFYSAREQNQNSKTPDYPKSGLYDMTSIPQRHFPLYLLRVRLGRGDQADLDFPDNSEKPIFLSWFIQSQMQSC